MEAARKYQPAGRTTADRTRDYEASPARRADKAFYKSPRWRRFRLWFLQQATNAICQLCRLKPANEVDHIKPRADYPELAFDADNCRGLCKSCHAREGSKRAKQR